MVAEALVTYGTIITVGVKLASYLAPIVIPRLPDDSSMPGQLKNLLLSFNESLEDNIKNLSLPRLSEAYSQLAHAIAILASDETQELVTLANETEMNSLKENEQPQGTTPSSAVILSIKMTKFHDEAKRLIENVYDYSSEAMADINLPLKERIKIAQIKLASIALLHAKDHKSVILQKWEWTISEMFENIKELVPKFTSMTEINGRDGILTIVQEVMADGIAAFNHYIKADPELASSSNPFLYCPHGVQRKVAWLWNGFVRKGLTYERKLKEQNSRVYDLVILPSGLLVCACGTNGLLLFDPNSREIQYRKEGTFKTISYDRNRQRLLTYDTKAQKGVSFDENLRNPCELHVPNNSGDRWKFTIVNSKLMIATVYRGTEIYYSTNSGDSWSLAEGKLPFYCRSVSAMPAPSQESFRLLITGSTFYRNKGWNFQVFLVVGKESKAHHDKIVLVFPLFEEEAARQYFTSSWTIRTCIDDDSGRIVAARWGSEVMLLNADCSAIKAYALMTDLPHPSAVAARKGHIYIAGYDYRVYAFKLQDHYVDPKTKVTYGVNNGKLEGMRRRKSGQSVEWSTPATRRHFNNFTKSTPATKKANLESLITREELDQLKDIRVKRLPQQEDELGEGAFGEVFLFKFADGSIQAGKRPKINLFNKSVEEENAIKKHLKHVLWEIRTLHQLSHERIIKIIGFYLDYRQIIIFMEAMEGSVKDEINEKKTLSEVEAIHYFTQAAEGLVYLHGRKPNAIIHRDIKGENLLLTVRKDVKLADFGLAVHLAIGSGSASLSQTAPTSLAGTCHFTAPEIIGRMHEPEAYGRKSDVWSLACTLVEMISGKPPHYNLSSFQIAQRSSPGSLNPLIYSGEELLSGASDAIKRLLNSLFIANSKLRPRAQDVLALAHQVIQTIANNGNMKSEQTNSEEGYLLPSTNNDFESNNMNNWEPIRSHYDTTNTDERAQNARNLVNLYQQQIITAPVEHERPRRHIPKTTDNVYKSPGRKAEQEDEDAQNKLGDYYCYGQDVPHLMKKLLNGT